MYLDPGSTSLFVQGLFALLATVFATVGRSRLWLLAQWRRVANAVSKGRRPTDS